MAPLDILNIRKVLVRSVNWIGDAVMTTPAMEAVRSCFPRAELVVAANPMVAELFSPHPWCDRVILFDKKGAHRGVRGFLHFAAGLKWERFDLAILFQNAVEAAILAFLARIPRRAGYATDGRGMLLTHAVPLDNRTRRMHHTDYYLEMLKALGISGSKRTLRLACTEEERAWARQLLGGNNWIAVNPGAAYGSAKRWLPDRFAAVADSLTKEFDAQIVLTGGPSEAAIGKEIEQVMEARPLNLIGRTSVRQMMAILSVCRLVVTNDSGPMHVAAALGIPIAALFGPTDHTTTSPLGASHRIVRHTMECSPCLLRTCPRDHQCMRAITVEEVLEAARTLMDNHP